MPQNDILIYLSNIVTIQYCDIKTKFPYIQQKYFMGTKPMTFCFLQQIKAYNSGPRKKVVGAFVVLQKSDIHAGAQGLPIGLFHCFFDFFLSYVQHSNKEWYVRKVL